MSTMRKFFLTELIKRGQLLFIPFLLLFVFVNKGVYAQFNFVYNDSTPVIKGNDTIPLAWAGGLSHPQFSTIDLDFDGVEELVTFDPYGPETGRVNVFKRKKVDGKVNYKYWYKGDFHFPTDLRFKMKLVDYDGDGKKDLFAYTVGGIKVYKNIGTPSNGVQWELIADPLKNYNDSTNTNLYSSSTEIPAYYDVDGDGDLDILTFRFGGTKSVVWNKNMSMETYGHADSLIFQIEEPCWGNFIESGTGNDIILNSTTPPCGSSVLPPLPGAVSRHQGGGSILALDNNDNGLTDLIIGDNEYNNITLVTNGGNDPTENADMISYDNAFPSYDTPVDLSNFVTAYYEDINLDGVKDLVVSTTELQLKTSENTRGVWYYRNNGTTNHPNFELQTKGFLQDMMIENGTGAIPLLVDVNNDGLADLLVANDFNYVDDSNPYSKNQSRVNYYENVGTSDQPVFKLKTENWNNFANSGYKERIVPSFADLDGDGDLDMIVGLKTGKLYYYENSGGSGTMNFSLAQTALEDNNGNKIIVSSNATPELFDLDNDGKIDLIIGQGNGPVLYYRNVGTNTNYSFELVNNDLGGIGAAAMKKAVPRFVRNNNTTYLFIGNEEGTLSFYDDIDGNLAQGDVFNLVSSEYLYIDTKGLSAPVIDQIRDDGSYDLFVGNTLGGLWSFRPGDTTYLSTEETHEVKPINPELTIYPNPNKGSFTLKVSDLRNEKYNYRIIDPLGRILISKKQESNPETNVHLDKSESGVYFLEVVTQKTNLRLVKKLMIE